MFSLDIWIGFNNTHTIRIPPSSVKGKNYRIDSRPGSSHNHPMRYLFAILLPPLAVLSCGKLFQFILSIILTLCFWIPGVIHAILVVSSYQADQRTRAVVKAIRSRE